MHYDRLFLNNYFPTSEEFGGYSKVTIHILFWYIKPGGVFFLGGGIEYVRPNASQNSFPIKSQGRLSITRTLSHSAQSVLYPYYEI